MQRLRWRASIGLGIIILLAGAAILALNHFKNEKLREQQVAAAKNEAEERAKKEKALTAVVNGYEKRLNAEAPHNEEKVSEAITNKQEFAREDAYPATTQEGQN